MPRFRSFMPLCDEDFPFPKITPEYCTQFFPAALSTGRVLVIIPTLTSILPGKWGDEELSCAPSLSTSLLVVPWGLMASAHLLFPHISVSQGTTWRRNAAAVRCEPKEVAGTEVGRRYGSRFQHQRPRPALVSQPRDCGFLMS